MSPHNFTETSFSASESPNIVLERSLFDYLLLTCYLLLFLFGAPVNVIAFAKFRKRHSDARKNSITRVRPRVKNSGLHDLRSQLNFSDILIVFVFTTSKICWSITFSWQGGENMCKLIKFLESTIFQLSSNLIVCIALDRLLLIIFRRRRTLHYAIIDVFCYLAWFSAPILHIWQLFLWTTVTPRPHDRSTWQQCVTVWHARHVELSTMNSSSHAEPFLSISTYTLISTFSISFMPLIIMITSYLMTAAILHRMELASSRPLLPQVVVTAECGSLVSSSENRYSSATKAPEASKAKAWPRIKKFEQTSDSNSLSKMGNSQQTIVVLSNGIQSIRRKTIRTSLVLLLSYVVCWFPYNVSNLWHVIFYPSTYDYESKGAKFACSFVVLNTILNPFLYGIVNVDICQHGHDKKNSLLKHHEIQRNCPLVKL